SARIWTSSRCWASSGGVWRRPKARRAETPRPARASARRVQGDAVSLRVLEMCDEPELSNALLRREHPAPVATDALERWFDVVHAQVHQRPVVYLSVDDIEPALERVGRHGGRVLSPKKSIGEFGFVAHFEDSEGNRT